MVDMMLHGGTIHILDDVWPRVSALAIQGDRIARVGDDDTILSMRTPDTKVVALKGKTVVPGFCDSHGHMRSLGHLQEQVDLGNARSFNEVVEMVCERVRQSSRDEWVLEHDLLNKAVPDNPVWLVRVDSHAGLANIAAMRRAGIDSTTDTPTGGLLWRAGGEPTGRFLDRAMLLVSTHILPVSVEKVKQLLLAAQDLCLASGLTEVHDAGVGQVELEAYHSLV